VIIALTCGIAVVVIAFILGVRAKDLPEPEPVSPFRHLDERKASIYENLRDLQFEYRVGKLSDADYQSTKQDLQKELAAVLAQVDQLKEQLQVQVGQVQAQPARGKPDKPQAGLVCPACGARFEKQLKFCGECGKPMKAIRA
jgi:rRNA maturation endonuclease Nob1